MRLRVCGISRACVEPASIQPVFSLRSAWSSREGSEESDILRTNRFCCYCCYCRCYSWSCSCCCHEIVWRRAMCDVRYLVYSLDRGDGGGTYGGLALFPRTKTRLQQPGVLSSVSRLVGDDF